MLVCWGTSAYCSEHIPLDVELCLTAVVKSSIKLKLHFKVCIRKKESCFEAFEVTSGKDFKVDIPTSSRFSTEKHFCPVLQMKNH